MSMRPRRAAAAAVALLGVLAVLRPAVATAGLAGRAQSATRTVTSGTWAVVPTLLTSGVPAPGALPLTFALGAVPVPQYFEAVNTGTITVTAASYSVAVTGGLSGTTAVTLTACVGASWDRTLGTCSGTPTTIGSWTSASSSAISSVAVPGPPSSRLSIKASVTGGSLVSVTVGTVSISVSSGPTRQIRAATTTNS